MSNWLAGASSAWWALFLSSAAISLVWKHRPSADILAPQHATTFLKHVNLIFELKEASSTMLLVRLRHEVRARRECGAYTFFFVLAIVLIVTLLPSLFVRCRASPCSLLSSTSLIAIVTSFLCCRLYSTFSAEY
jgi:hypothetical protein